MYDFNLKIDEKVRHHQYQHKGRFTLLALFSPAINHHYLHLASVQYITETGAGQERTKKLKISVAVVCRSVKILKIRKMVNKTVATSS